MFLSCTRHSICSFLAMAPQYIFDSHCGKCQLSMVKGASSLSSFNERLEAVLDADAFEPLVAFVDLPITRR